MVANEKGVVYEGSFGKRDIAKPDEMTLIRFSGSPP